MRQGNNQIEYYGKSDKANCDLSTFQNEYFHKHAKQSINEFSFLLA